MFLWGIWVSLGRQKFFPLTRLHCLSGRLGDFWSLELLPNNPVQFILLSSNGCSFQNKHPMLKLTLTLASSFVKET